MRAKADRRGFVFLTVFLAVFAQSAALCAENVTLCYHSFDYSLKNIYATLPDVFEWELDLAMAAYFEAAAQASGRASWPATGSWASCRAASMPARSPSRRRRSAGILLALLIKQIADGTISNDAARQVFERCGTARARDVDAVIGAGTQADERCRRTGRDRRRGDGRQSGQVEQFRAGKDKAFNALVGQAMKATKGKANPAQVERTAEEEAGVLTPRRGWRIPAIFGVISLRWS